MGTGSVEARASPRSDAARAAGATDSGGSAGVVASDNGPLSKGQLLAAPAVSLERVFPAPAFDSLVRHYWIPRWSIPDGGEVRQDVLDYPSMNLVIEPHDARLYRALRGRSTQLLSGSGWAFGVLLQPGTGRRLLGASARTMPSTGVPVGRLAADDTDGLVEAIRRANSRAMPRGGEADADEDAGAHAHADVAVANTTMIRAFESWLAERDLAPDPDADLVRSIVAAVETDRSLLRVDDLAGRFDVGVRHLQRLVNAYIGFGPKWLIQRYRLQEAARALEDPVPPGIADLAAALGYADQAHFAREFKTVVGVPPRAYRAEAERIQAEGRG